MVYTSTNLIWWMSCYKDCKNNKICFAIVLCLMTHVNVENMVNDNHVMLWIDTQWLSKFI